jgi:hypothetical protein
MPIALGKHFVTLSYRISLGSGIVHRRFAGLVQYIRLKVPDWNPPPKGLLNAVSTLVLIVEDDADSRLLIARTLSKAGYEIVCATNGLEALEYIARNAPPDVIVSDYRMPTLDGQGLIEALRANPLWTS